MIQGVIFDFNGTMILDSKVQIEAWVAFLSELLHREVSYQEYEKYVYGKINSEVMQHFLDPKMSYEEAEVYGNRKEEVYINMVKEKEIPLADGLEDFLQYLKEHDYPIAMATSAPYIVVRSLYDYYRLDRFFPFEAIVYDHKGLKGKPAPDLYYKALERLGKKAEECVCFEDSASGILAAKNAGIGTICVMDPYSSYPDGYPDKEREYYVLNNFKKAIEVL